MCRGKQKEHGNNFVFSHLDGINDCVVKNFEKNETSNSVWRKKHKLEDLKEHEATTSYRFPKALVYPAVNLMDSLVPAPVACGPRSLRISLSTSLHVVSRLASVHSLET